LFIVLVLYFIFECSSVVSTALGWNAVLYSWVRMAAWSSGPSCL